MEKLTELENMPSNIQISVVGTYPVFKLRVTHPHLVND